MLFVDYLVSPIGQLAIDTDNETVISLRVVSGSVGSPCPNWLTDECKRQLEEYFQGGRVCFELPLKFDGTEFQKAVWRELLKLDFGETCSYSDLAKAVGNKTANRAVGNANRLNRLPILIPCHRVIGKDASLTGYALGIDKKAWLLRHEGLDF